MKRYTILLTACINPNGMSFTHLNDPLAREKQYIDAINFYLESTNYNVVFCNNSGEDIRTKLTKSKRFEYLSFKGNNYNNTIGKGFGEIEIIKYALENSSFIKHSKYIIKITGRLTVVNLQQAIKLTNTIWLPKRDKIYFSAVCTKEKFIDSRCFIAKKNLFKELILNADKLNDAKGYYFEHLLFDISYTTKIRKKICIFFPILEIQGISGSTGEIYEIEKKTTSQKLYDLRNFLQLNKQNQDLSMFIRIYLSTTSSIVRFLRFIERKIKKHP